VGGASTSCYVLLQARHGAIMMFSSAVLCGNRLYWLEYHRHVFAQPIFSRGRLDLVHVMAADADAAAAIVQARSGNAAASTCRIPMGR